MIEAPPVVDTEWLAKNLGAENIVVLDIRKDSEYGGGRIVNAVNIPRKPAWYVDKPVKGLVVTKDKIEPLLSGVGIGKDTWVVVVDKKTERGAARILWPLNYYGHTKASILDGGFEKWKKENRPTTRLKAKVTPATFVAKPNPDFLATKEQVLEAIEGVKKGTHVIIDCRTPAEYKGEEIKAKRGGHIPGAININFTENLRKGCFKPVAELKSLYEAKGVTKDKEIIVYCQTGTRSSVTWFVLYHLLGYEKVRNYDGSNEEWGNDLTLPMEK